MISTAEINKVLRKTLSPFLRENGFSVVQARKAWGWHDHCVWVLNIRAVGKYFSQVTGWPPMSVGVSTGIYYDFIPEEGRSPYVHVDAQGRLCPDEVACHIRSHLEITLDQQSYQSQLTNLVERRRKDIWWIAPNGENVSRVVEDIADSFMTHGIGWYIYHTDLVNAFSEIERGHDCLIKFYQAAHFARHLGYEAQYQEYLKRLERERERIGRMG